MITPRQVFFIRKATGAFGCTQEHFAHGIGVSPRTYRNWEQGTRKPTGAAEVLLRMIEQAPMETIALLKRPGIASAE